MSKWKIKHINEKQCEMKYNVEFEFRNIIYQQVSQFFIDIVGDKMTKAFEKRIQDEDLKRIEMLKKDTYDQKYHEIKKKNLHLLPTSPIDILESLKVKINYFYKLHKISDVEFEIIMEIIDQNLDLKEFLIQAYVLFCKNNYNYRDGEYKLLYYLKDISLMNKIKVVN